ncbi:alpha/beta hydrolase family protein [Nitrincola sp.]|uniref:alpha/beta hydrolase family protein n=1 Tax=Nitrincola sp. TaxID=1926584 RepID=UPI003A8CB728
MHRLQGFKRLYQGLLFIGLGLCITTVQAQDPSSTQNYTTARIDFSLEDTQTGRNLEGYIWYPSVDSSEPVWAHGNTERVWEPIAVVPDAAPIEGSFPVLVLSHGMFGTAHNQAWLAQAMVAQGYLVVAINHPGTSHFFRDPEQRRELWQRARDISRVIDYVSTDFVFADQVRQDEIYMAGHSLGGHTAMMLAGAQYSAKQFDEFCQHNSGELVCGLFTDWGVAKTPDDIQQMEMDWSDSRIKAFAIFDLGGSQSFDRNSLAAIDVPMLIYAAPKDIMGLDLDIESRYLITKLSQQTFSYHEPEQLAHFDFLGVCTEKALQVLTAEEPSDRYVCIEGRDERRAMHQQIIEQLSAFLQVNGSSQGGTNYSLEQ